jgi:hypothetical protein
VFVWFKLADQHSLAPRDPDLKAMTANGRPFEAVLNDPQTPTRYRRLVIIFFIFFYFFFSLSSFSGSVKTNREKSKEATFFTVVPSKGL